MATVPFPAAAGPSGLAWDSVTKIAVNGNPSSPQPGNFDDDFAAASAAQMPDQGGSGGGMFGQMHQAMAMGQAMKQLMATGVAERHYVAGSKERVDNLSRQTATITDCDARTIARLDLRNKTYTVESMDHPSSSTSAGRGPGGAFNDNGTRIAISVTNTALGSRVVAGQPTSGYRSDATLTETSSSGETHTQNANLIGYYSSFDNPAPGCSRPYLALERGRMMASYSQLMGAFAAGGTDKRFSITQSGPPLPLGKLAMFDAVAFGAQGQGVTFVNERGNVRALSATDPVFAIPPGFTQRQ